MEKNTWHGQAPPVRKSIADELNRRQSEPLRDLEGCF